MGVELTYQDVAEHNTKKDLYVVISDKIYDCTKFVDEHPYVPPQLSARCVISLGFVNASGAAASTVGSYR